MNTILDQNNYYIRIKLVVVKTFFLGIIIMLLYNYFDGPT